MRATTIATSLVALCLIFWVAFAMLHSVTEPVPAASAASAAESTASPWLTVNPKADVNMRSCAGTGCPALAIVEKGSVVSPTGQAATVENSQGAVVVWQEVTLLSGRYCLPDEANPRACATWLDAPGPRGWISAPHLRARP